MTVFGWGRDYTSVNRGGTTSRMGGAGARRDLTRVGQALKRGE